MKLIKGKKYILFGNFPNPEKTQKEFKELLGIDIVCFLNDVDTTVAMEYEDTPIYTHEEVEKLKRQIDQLRKEKNKGLFGNLFK